MTNVLPLKRKDFTFEKQISELSTLCKEDIVSVNTIYAALWQNKYNLI